jgi:hypothetical protein
VRRVDQIEQRVAADLSLHQPNLFTDYDALLSLKDFTEDRVSGVLEEFLLNEALSATAYIRYYMQQREQRCKVCGRQMLHRPMAVDGSVRASRRKEMLSENGRPREYCSNRCRQRAYRDRKLANRRGQPTATDDRSARPA